MFSRHYFLSANKAQSRDTCTAIHPPIKRREFSEQDIMPFTNQFNSIPQDTSLIQSLPIAIRFKISNPKTLFGCKMSPIHVYPIGSCNFKRELIDRLKRGYMGQ